MITLGKRDTLQSRRRRLLTSCCLPSRRSCSARSRRKIRGSRWRLHTHYSCRKPRRDNAKVAILELIGYEFKLKEKKEKPKKEEEAEVKT